MATTWKLPKVTEYVKNVGKSLAFASIDAVKDNSPGIKEFIDTNDDIFKEVYSSVKNYRSTMKTIEQAIKQNNIYQAVDAGIKNMIDDIKTGKLYNDRTDEVGESALGLDDFDDMDMNISFNDDDDSFDDSAKILSDSFSDAIGAAATSQNTVVGKSTSLMIRTNKASTKLIMAHMDKTSAAMASSIGSVYSAVSVTNAFLNGPMKAHLENSKRYYEENLKATTEMNLMLKEILEMQRNLYKAEREVQKSSKLDESMGYDGSINIAGYFKNVKSNLSEFADSIGLSAMKMDLGGGNPYMLYAAAPFKMILGPLMDRMLSKDFKKALNSFDKGVTTMFSQLVARMNTAKKNDDGSLLSILGNLFGISIDKKDDINTSKFKKEAVPFDGITRQSIIETIPGYLSRIEAALTGGSERHYDYRSGTWKSARQIQSEFDDDKEYAITRANYNLINDIEENLLRPMESSGDKGQKKAKKMRKQVRNLASKIFADGGDFRPYEEIDFSKGYERYGFTKKDFEAILKSITKDTMRGLAANNMRERQNLSNTRRDQEANGGVQRQLYNGAYDITGSGNGKRHNPSDYVGSGRGLLASSVDDSGRNVFWYLREILDSIQSHRKKKKETKNAKRNNGKANRARQSHTSSSSDNGGDDSSDDGDPDDEEELDSNYFYEMEVERRREEQEKNDKNIGTWLSKKLGNSSIGKAISKLLGGAASIFNKPMEFMTKMLNKADDGIFKLMFGNEKLQDMDGKPIKSIFHYIINEVKTSFNKIREDISNKFKEWTDKLFKPLWEKWIKPIVDNMKNMFKTGWDRIKKGVSNTFGKGKDNIIEKIRRKNKKSAEDIENGGVAGAEDIENGNAQNSNSDEEPITESAFGRYVTKRGLTMISPGEMIIPASFDKKEQKKMLALEKRDRSRIENAIGLNAKGTVDTEGLKKNLNKIYEENIGKGAKNAAGGVIGAGAGLLTGVNPLLGAMAGAGLSILSNSETFKTAIFGKENKEGEREGGLLPKKITKFFQKALPDIEDFGIAGGLLGLITPLGPLGGAAVGAGIGMLKNSEGFKKFIFGDADTGKDGLISKKSAEKAKEFLKKGAPKAIIGAVAGMFAGPFGLIGNAALGAGAGLIASTDSFHKVLFGNKEEGTNGLLGAINTGILEPAKEKIAEFLTSFKEYTKKHILDPLKNFWKPFQQSIKNTITSVGDGVKDYLNDMFEKKVGLPIADFLQEKLFKPLTKVVFGILKAPVAVGKAIVAAPFKALGGIGNTMRMSQIRKGSAHDMSASERLAWREEHKGRGFFREVIGGKDKMLEQDQMLAGMDEDQLRNLMINSRAGLETTDVLQKNKGKAREAVGKEFSKFFNEKVDGKNRYSRVNYSKVKKVLENILDKGDVNYAKEQILKIDGLTPDEKNALISQVSEQIAAVGTANKTYDQALKGNKETDKTVSKLLGRKINGRKDRRQIYRSAEAELKARSSAAKAGTDQAPSSPEEGAIKEFKDLYEERTNKLLEVVTDAGIALKRMINPNYDPKHDDNYKNFAKTVSDAGAGNEKDIYYDVLNRGISAVAMDLTKQNDSNADIKHAIMRSARNENRIIKGYTTKSSEAINTIKGQSEEDEDSKEAVDARKAEEAKKSDEKTANDAERKQVGWLEKIATALGVGKKKNSEKEEGLLGSIGAGISGVLNFIGVPVASIAKWGLRAVGIAGGVSLLGYASEWIKTSFWPKLKEILFGTKDADGNVTSTGLLSGIGTSFKTALFGDGTAENPGLIAKLENTAIGRFFTGIQSNIDKAGGIMPWIASDILPAVAEKLVTGWGYAMENIVTPLVALVVKHLPSLVASLGKALITGITSAILKKEIKIDKKDEPSSEGAVKDINNTMSGTRSSLAKGAGTEITKYFKDTKVTGTTASFDWGAAFDSNYATADETYDSEGNHLNKTSDEIMYKDGFLGSKHSTNQLYYDENGNIALNSYDTMNTTDSIASRVAKSAGSGFVRGIGGTTGLIGKALAKVSGKGAGKGYVKLGTGMLGTGVKTTGKTLNAGNKLGLKINNALNQTAFNSALSGAEQKYIDDLVTAGIGSVDDITKLVGEKGITGAAADLVKNSPLKGTANWESARHTIMDGAKNANISVKPYKNAATASADNLAAMSAEAAENAAKKPGLLSKVKKLFKGSSEATDNVASAAANVADDAAKPGIISKAVDKIKTKISKKGAEKAGISSADNIASAATNATDNLASAAAKNVDNAGAKVAETVGKVAASSADNAATGLGAKIAKFFTNFAKDSKVLGFLSKACSPGTTQKVLGEAIEKLGKKLGDTIVGKASTKALGAISKAVGKFSPLTIAIWVADFISGYDQADTLLGVAKGDEYKVGFGQKCLCGLLNVINNQLTFGLIPTETIIDIIVEFLFPVFGLDAEALNAARDRADDALQAWNEAHPEETYTNLEDFNNKDKWWFKAGNALKKTVGGAWDKTKEVAGAAWDKTKEVAGKAWDKTKEVAGAAWDKTKELGGKAVTLVKDGFNAVADKTKEVVGGALDIGTFIKDCVANTIKAATNPEFTWNIDSYLSEDDPLSGVKKVVYQVIRIPMGVVGIVAKISKTLFDKIKGFVLDIKDGIGDAWQDISSVATGKYSVFSKEYWNFNDKDEGDNPLGIISKIASTVLKVMAMPQSMIGYVGSKIWQGLKAMISGAKEGGLDAAKDIKGVVTGKYTVFSKEYWSSNKEGEGEEENSMSLLGKIFGTITRVISAPKAMLGYVGTKAWEGFKSLISGAKEGILDSSSDVKAVKSGKYTIFNKNYWKSDRSTGDNELSLLGSIFGFVSRVFQAPSAMLGWVGTKVWGFIKTMISGAKEGILDATSDVQAVKSGEYTIFNKDYWKSDRDEDNPLSKVGSIFGFISRVFQAPSAMLGWVGTKVWNFIKAMIDGAKEGALDASTDVAAVKRGEYTIFNKNYWKSDSSEENPLSMIGSIFGFVSRVFQAPSAMLGWVGTKVKEVFTAMIDGAKEGALDASTDVAAVKRGDYTVFDKRYWTSDADEDNPLSKVGSVFGFIMRLSQAPMAMIGYVFTKVKEIFTSMIGGVKDITNDTNAVIDRAEKGEISVFSGEYWKVEVDENNPLGLLGKIMGFIQRLINAPIVLIKGVFGKIKDAFGGITDTVKDVGDKIGGVTDTIGGVVDSIGGVLGGIGDTIGGVADSIGDTLGGIGDKIGGALGGIGDWFSGITGGGSRGGKGRRSGVSRRLGGRGHIYQSDAAISNMRYGDSTIAKAGCAPVAATNLINSINPNSMDVQQAAAYAEKNNLTMRGGGTDINYFNKFLRSQGIATMNTRNKDAVLAALKNGNQVVMLGQDGNNNPGAPFGTNPHFVTAKGIDKNGNIIVEDPDLPQSSVVYKQDKLLNSMTSSIITDGSKIKSKKYNKHGLGRKLWGAGDGEESEVSVEALMSEVGNIGSSIVKQMFGSAYDALYGNDEEETSDPIRSTQSTAAANLTGNDNAEKIWNYLRNRGYTQAGAAGLMGNLYAESGLRPNNIQNSYESKYGTDDVYTSAVDSKSRGKDAFSKDSAGYGLAQWTYHTRKKGLYEATVEQGKSISDLGSQLAYLDTELANNYPAVYKTLTTTTSTNTASDKVLTDFERPAKLNYDARRNYSQNMYSQFAGSGRAGTGSARDALNSYGYMEETAGTARAIDNAPVSRSVDYVTFLETIVSILMNISNNTALLSKILEILSEKFNIDLDRAKVEAAANTMSREQTRAALNELVKRNGGNSSNISKLLNNQDTDYIVAAMSAIASE